MIFGGSPWRRRPSRFRSALPALLATLLCSGAAGAQQIYERNGELYAGTFSIAAIDRETGEIGIAVTSRVPCVGNIVPHVQVGVGAVVTQALIRVEYGPELLTLLAAGTDPQDALDEALADDPAAPHRQIALITADGRSAQHTGDAAIAWAGERSGRDYVTQGNVVVGPDVLDAVAKTFEASGGTGKPLAERLIEALEAGNLMGGDRRKGALQSAAVVVADPRPGRYLRPDGITVDVEICKGEDPMNDLRHVYNSVMGNLGYRTLQQYHGSDVIQLKIILHALGYYRRSEKELRMELTIQFFTQELVTAVNAFREGHGLTGGPTDGSPPGLVDPETIALMWRELEERGIAAEVRRRLREFTQLP